MSKQKDKKDWDQVIQDYKQAQEQREYFQNAYLVRTASVRKAVELLRKAKLCVNAQGDDNLEQEIGEFLRIHGHLENIDV